MEITRRMKKITAGALLSVGLVVAGCGLTADIAEAQPGPVPLDAWPGCPNDHPQGPCHWCPGQSLPPTGNHVTNPVVWDNNICHTWFWVPVGGMGNVGQLVWDGDTPPPHGPPPCYGAPICLPGL